MFLKCEIIFIDYIKKEKTVNGEFYANLLQHLSGEIKKKRPHFAKKKLLFELFHQNNATRPGIRYRDCQIWKKYLLDSKSFANNEKVESAVACYFEALDYSHYDQGAVLLTLLGKAYRAEARLCLIFLL